MNNNAFSTELRKFLKTVGITAQREIEAAVQKAIADQKLDGTETLNARVELHVSGVDLHHTIEGTVALE